MPSAGPGGWTKSGYALSRVRRMGMSPPRGAARLNNAGPTQRRTHTTPEPSDGPVQCLTGPAQGAHAVTVLPGCFGVRRQTGAGVRAFPGRAGGRAAGNREGAPPLAAGARPSKRKFPQDMPRAAASGWT